MTDDIYFCLQEKLAKFKKYNAHSAHVTNVRWAHDDSCVVTVGGADLAMIVWSNLDEGTPRTVAGGVDESDGDTDSEEESGYDSDVDREKKIDYTTKTYTSSLRETSGTKPQHQAKEESRKYASSLLFCCLWHLPYHLIISWAPKIFLLRNLPSQAFLRLLLVS